DIGGGTSDIAVLSLGDIVASSSLRVAGDRLNTDIVNFVRQNFGLLIGEHTAERIKIEIGTAVADHRHEETQVRGRDVVNGLPKEITLDSNQIEGAIHDTLESIVVAA